MRISENWLREWVDSAEGLNTIAERLTMAGLEVDGIEHVGADLAGVIVGRVETCQPHPDADKLQVCRVDVGDTEDLPIVCGAPNVAPGVRVPVATVGSTLPNGLEIKKARLRGVESRGMLCSAAELALASDASGLWLLADDAPVGTALTQYLGLPDRVMEIDLTPNRGDCLSLRGVARELVANSTATLKSREMPAAPTRIDQVRTVYIDAPDRCAGYAARCVSDIEPSAATPLWLTERLRRAGIRGISLPVDIGNYVMLEYGQPMHAFDGDKLQGAIRVRLAIAGERIVTLDDTEVVLAADTLVIADDEGAVAIAGMIGGRRTAVDKQTRNVVFEAACFTPAGVAGQGRRYKIHTDSLHRFERGVDPKLHRPAINYASALLIDCGGGAAGPTVHAEGTLIWPERREIELRASHVARLLGQAIAVDDIEQSLAALGVDCTAETEGVWLAVPPSWRYDLNIEADLIEEIARVYGYDRLQSEAAGVELPAVRAGDAAADPALVVGSALRQRGYSEAITYSFVAPDLHAALTGGEPALVLDNPISDQLVEMRRTLWAGLLPAWAYNARRQQSRIRLYEIGLQFVIDPAGAHGIVQRPVVAGLAAGSAHPAHWDNPARELDFFDIKGDVEALFAGSDSAPRFEAAHHPGLHPGRSAAIYQNEHRVGWLGQLAPDFNKFYKNKAMPYLFEVDLQALKSMRRVDFMPVSEQPQVHRDLALVVSEDLPVAALSQAITVANIDTLQSVEVFDVFRGQGLETGFKSVALSLIFQDKASTLTDERVDELMRVVTAAVSRGCGAIIRGG